MSNTPECEVGAVVFWLDKQSSTIRPCLIVEETSTRSIAGGKKITYRVSVAGTGDRNELELDPAKEEIYTTANAVREILVERSTKAVEALVERAVALSRALSTMQGQEPSAESRTTENDQRQLVQLPDGTVARVKIRETGGVK